MRWVPPALPTAKSPENEKTGATFVAGRSRILKPKLLFGCCCSEPETNFIHEHHNLKAQFINKESGTRRLLHCIALHFVTRIQEEFHGRNLALV
uniref:Uncharacterized protein n=1 Tax=Lactuca sativa TaxID=4236 RepID=A0A9R1VUM3_LACSA|nr:hypothetical protein LSAT_V11C400191510 [Lactuca sativa]